MAPSSSRSTRSRRGLAGVSANTSMVLPGPHRRGERAGLGAVDEGDVDAEARAHRLEQQLGAGVELALGDDVVAGRAQAEHHRADRPHARGERPGRLGALELGDGLLEAARRWGCRSGCRSGRRRPRSPCAGPRRRSGVTNVVRGPQDRGERRCRCRPGPARMATGLGVQRRRRSVGVPAGRRRGHRSSFSISVEERRPAAAPTCVGLDAGSRRGRAGCRCRRGRGVAAGDAAASRMRCCWYGG